MTSRTEFRAAIDELRAEVDRLGSLAQDAVRLACAGLFDSQAAHPELVLTGDDDIDLLVVELEERAYALIAQQAPVAADLRFLVSALRIMADWERAADRAVSIVKLSMATWPREPVTLDLLLQMAGVALELMEDARRAWREEDLELARALERRDDALDDSYRDLVAHLLSQQGPEASGLVLHAHLIGRYLERIADHAVAVGDRVSYTLTGDADSLAAEIG